jgi:hypothetical protein
MINDCNELINHKNIVVSEKRSKFKILNDSLKSINKVKVDGCLITNGKRCDYLFEICSDNFEKVFYVELKGSDLKKALEQIEATINYCNIYHKHKDKQKYAFVVTTRTPQIDSAIQNLKRNLKNKKIKLETKNNEIEVKI